MLKLNFFPRYKASFICDDRLNADSYNKENVFPELYVFGHLKCVWMQMVTIKSTKTQSSESVLRARQTQILTVFNCVYLNETWSSFLVRFVLQRSEMASELIKCLQLFTHYLINNKSQQKLSLWLTNPVTTKYICSVDHALIFSVF